MVKTDEKIAQPKQGSNELPLLLIITLVYVHCILVNINMYRDFYLREFFLPLTLVVLKTVIVFGYILRIHILASSRMLKTNDNRKVKGINFSPTLD